VDLRCADRVVGDNLFAACLHGSPVLGGYRLDRSDLDVLALVHHRITDADVDAVAAGVLAGPYPARGLEMSLGGQVARSRDSPPASPGFPPDVVLIGIRA
jgi:hypothetical protein